MTRIEELRTLTLLDPDELDEVFAHIDAFTAQLAAKDAQIAGLRAACEKVVSYHDPHGREFVDHAALIHEYVTLCRHALAATDRG